MPPGSTRCRSTSSPPRCSPCATSSTSCRRRPRTTGAPSRSAWPRSPPPSRATRSRCSLARERGQVSPRRQVDACAEQSRDLIADDGYFAKIVADAHGRRRRRSTARCRDQLADAAKAASAAYGDMADWLERELLPHAPEADACGRERYAARVALLPRRDGRPRGDLPLGPAGGRDLHAQMSEIAEGLEAGRQRRSAASRSSTPTSVPAARHGRAQGLDAGARRRGHRQPQGRPLRHPRAGRSASSA